MEYCRFLELYRVYSEHNETPELIHLWTALSTLAGACEKRLWIDRSFFRIYFNLYILFVAPAGVCAKSTSMGLGLKLLKDAGFTVLESSITKEKIIEDMAAAQKVYITPSNQEFTQSPVTFFSDELNVLLSSGVDMIKFLVEMWNKDDIYTYKTKNRGTYEVIYPSFNLLGAAVPQWFGESVASDLGSTGFLARCIVVYEEQKRGKYPEPYMTDKQVQARQQLLEMVMAIGEMYGETKIDEEARQYFNDWYMKQEVDVAEDYRIAAYLERRTKVHVLKIAGLMAVGDLRKEITVTDIKRAAHILQRTETKMRLAYLVAGSNRLAPHVARICSMLDKQKEIPIRDIVRSMYIELDRDAIKNVLETLVSMEVAAREKKGDTTYLVKL